MFDTYFHLVVCLRKTLSSHSTDKQLALSDITVKLLIGTFEVIDKRNKKFQKLVEDVYKLHMQKYAKIT